MSMAAFAEGPVFRPAGRIVRRGDAGLHERGDRGGGDPELHVEGSTSVVRDAVLLRFRPAGMDAAWSVRIGRPVATGVAGACARSGAPVLSEQSAANQWWSRGRAHQVPPGDDGRVVTCGAETWGRAKTREAAPATNKPQTMRNAAP